ncbi:MAG TPA: isoprenylcysteine carboxylmethyltransferase family protein [bacterium]|nr:isoprenylcysteine carboxylmethyltransferase family protein [bacterium]
MNAQVLAAVGFALGFYGVTAYAVTRTARLTGASPVIIFRTGTAEEKASVVLMWIFPLVVVAAGLLPDRALTRPLFDAPTLRVVGMLGLAAGLWLHVVALRTLGAAFQIGVDPSKTPGIVRTGPYRLVRHPVYAAFLIYFLGTWLLIPNVLFSIVAPLAAMRIYLQTRYEEAALLRRFGPEYAEYMRSTARFIPGVF